MTEPAGDATEGMRALAAKYLTDWQPHAEPTPRTCGRPTKRGTPCKLPPSFVSGRCAAHGTDQEREQARQRREATAPGFPPYELTDKGREIGRPLNRHESET